MSMILDGKKTGQDIQDELKQMVKHYGLEARLDVISIGNDSASEVYVRNKAKAAEYIGIKFKHWKLDKDISQQDIKELIYNLNTDSDVTGIIVQLPLPKHMNAQIVIGAINPKKDVDGFTYTNQGKLIYNAPGFQPCTPKGIIELLQRYQIRVDGKHAVVIGRSNIVGRPIAEMLLRLNATVTICHSQTKLMQLASMLGQADIVVSAVGEANFIKPSMLIAGNNPVIIDVGMNRDNNGKLCGDVNTACYEYCSAYTPVPGGVGPMTIAMLMKNVVDRALIIQNNSY